MSFKSLVNRSRKARSASREDSSRRERVVEGSLSDRIEVSSSPADNVDLDLLPYVDSLVSRIHALKPLEEISLLAQEDATQALAMIDETMKVLQLHLGKAESLKKLLEQKR
ncbi:MAG: hypothetical protein U0136_01585 [Bdellovibrionota bacterium]